MSEASTNPPEEHPDDPALSREQLKALYDRRKALRAKMRPTKPTTYQVTGQVSELGLENYALELESMGYTVFPPEKVAPPEFIQLVTETILRV
ncbi:MAG: hypothetical protein O7F71_18255, partial [Gammaproteobacteria bacterium]|nr:hypothetical protein [Gammaproteobacteria bacterium]